MMEMDPLELKILHELCREGKAHSSVALTCDLYGRAEAEPDSEEAYHYRTLEWTLVEALLIDLNAKGLVTYRLGQYDLFVHIRPTRKAYEALHIDRQWIVTTGTAGSSWQHSRYERPIHPGDVTDFRGYSKFAKAFGPPIHEDFVDHCVACDHFDRHRAQLIELYGTDQL